MEGGWDFSQRRVPTERNLNLTLAAFLFLAIDDCYDYYYYPESPT